MRIALQILVGVIGLILGVGLGLRWLFAPETIATDLGITLGNVAALSTARADLGGMFLAGGILCVLGLRPGGGRWLQAVALIIGCVALGRAISLVLDGFATQQLTFLIAELVTVGALLGAARRLEPASSA